MSNSRTEQLLYELRCAENEHDACESAMQYAETDEEIEGYALACDRASDEIGRLKAALWERGYYA